MKYVEIIDNSIIKTHTSLPSCYRNISNFFSLDKENLKDLSWSGNEGVKFYECEEIGMPEFMGSNVRVLGPTYQIDDESYKVVATYTWEEVEPEPEPVPETITATQIRLWLVRNNIPLDSINTALDQIEDVNLREETKVQWEYAPYVERNHQFINSLGNQLGLTPEQIDDAFREASKF